MRVGEVIGRVTLSQMHPLVRGAMLPKSESVADLVALHARLRADQVLLPLVETVRGWYQALELARAPGVQRLAFGSVDFCADSGIRGDREELILVRSQLVLLSRLAGLAAPLDGVSLDAGPWWCNVRMSNTEPLLRLNLEAKDQATVDRSVAEVSKLLGKRVEH